MKREPSLQLQPKQQTSFKQYHLLMMQPRMQQAIALLQAPTLELASLIERELEKNPLLEREEVESENVEETPIEISETELNIDDNDFNIMSELDEQYKEHFAESGGYSNRQDADEEKKRAFLENNVQARETLFQKLMQQAKETFEDPEHIAIAEEIIGNFDESGYVKTSLEEISLLCQADVDLLKELLKKIQSFEPYGVGAKDIHECLLIQLRCKGKENSLAYEIVNNHYEDLLHNRIPKIRKDIHCTEEVLQDVIEQEIAKLDLHPGLAYSSKEEPYLVPDAIVREDMGTFTVEINDEYLPTIRLNSRYLRMFHAENTSEEMKLFIRKHFKSAKWFVRNVYQRNETLTRIIRYIIEKQHPFFTNADGALNPLNMREVARELELHESTIARAVANKYVYTPRGMFLLRSFFTNALISNSGVELSSDTVRKALKRMIDSEDKSDPLSDQEISDKLKEIGILCARRTVAKYRKQIGIGTSVQRRRYFE